VQVVLDLGCFCVFYLVYVLVTWMSPTKMADAVLSVHSCGSKEPCIKWLYIWAPHGKHDPAFMFWCHYHYGSNLFMTMTIWSLYCTLMHARTHARTHAHNRFTALFEFVRDYPVTILQCTVIEMKDEGREYLLCEFWSEVLGWKTVLISSCV